MHERTPTTDCGIVIGLSQPPARLPLDVAAANLDLALDRCPTLQV